MGKSNLAQRHLAPSVQHTRADFMQQPMRRHSQASHESVFAGTFSLEGLLRIRLATRRLRKYRIPNKFWRPFQVLNEFVEALMDSRSDKRSLETFDGGSLK